MKGPIVYCVEEADNTADLHLYELCPTQEMKETTVKIAGAEIPAIVAQGRKRKQRMSDSLYEEYVPAEYEDAGIVYIPYYAWANRGENEMAVWLRIQE